MRPLPLAPIDERQPVEPAASQLLTLLPPPASQARRSTSPSPSSCRRAPRRPPQESPQRWRPPRGGLRTSLRPPPQGGPRAAASRPTSALPPGAARRPAPAPSPPGRRHPSSRLSARSGARRRTLSGPHSSGTICSARDGSPGSPLTRSSTCFPSARADPAWQDGPHGLAAWQEFRRVPPPSAMQPLGDFQPWY